MKGDYYCSSDDRTEKAVRWRKIRNRDVLQAENLLRDIENDYVTACTRFLARRYTRTRIWNLCAKNKRIVSLLIYSGSTVMPVLCGRKEIPQPYFFNNFLQTKKIHAVQGITEEVIIFENVMQKSGKVIADIYDYDLMSLDTLPLAGGKSTRPENLVLRPARMTDLDAIAPLQASYEQEEVLPKGSVFSPAASRMNIANIIAAGRVFTAELNGRMVGKINISGVSFTRYLVGGVYVHPDFRSKGIARRMAAEFAASLINEGRGVTLFVKKNNTPARKLYLGLGFKVRGDYRITYY